jgi:hypothetical protein
VVSFRVVQHGWKPKRQLSASPPNSHSSSGAVLCALFMIAPSPSVALDKSFWLRFIYQASVCL